MQPVFPSHDQDRILEQLKKNPDGLLVNQLLRQLDMAKGKVVELLYGLEERGVVEHLPSKRRGKLYMLSSSAKAWDACLAFQFGEVTTLVEALGAVLKLDESTNMKLQLGIWMFHMETSMLMEQELSVRYIQQSPELAKANAAYSQLMWKKLYEAMDTFMTSLNPDVAEYHSAFRDAEQALGTAYRSVFPTGRKYPRVEVVDVEKFARTMLGKTFDQIEETLTRLITEELVHDQAVWAKNRDQIRQFLKDRGPARLADIVRGTKLPGPTVKQHLGLGRIKGVVNRDGKYSFDEAFASRQDRAEAQIELYQKWAKSRLRALEKNLSVMKDPGAVYDAGLKILIEEYVLTLSLALDAPDEEHRRAQLALHHQKWMGLMAVIVHALDSTPGRKKIARRRYEKWKEERRRKSSTWRQDALLRLPSDLRPLGDALLRSFYSGKYSWVYTLPGWVREIQDGGEARLRLEKEYGGRVEDSQLQSLSKYFAQ